MRSYKIVTGLLLIVAAGVFSIAASENSKDISINKEKLLERHNFYRDKVGVPPLEWSDELAVYAQNWANKLANKCDMYHSAGSYGENIYWTSGTANESDVVDYWATEERYFNHRNTVYKRGTGARSGHYSQIIWKKTTHVGGAVANCKHGGQIWVCSYDPHGNVIGQKAY